MDIIILNHRVKKIKIDRKTLIHKYISKKISKLFNIQLHQTDSFNFLFCDFGEAEFAFKISTVVAKLFVY